jgi:hypothetical protein
MDGIVLTGEYRSTRTIKRTSVTLSTINPIRNVLIYKPQYTKSTSIFLPLHKQQNAKYSDMRDQRRILNELQLSQPTFRPCKGKVHLWDDQPRGLVVRASDY